MSRVTNTIFIRGDASAIFDFVTTAKHWTTWHPATLGVSGQIEEPMRLGDVIRERAHRRERRRKRLDGDRVGKNTRVVLSMPNTRLGDLQITYTFARRDGGVEFTRELVFEASAFSPEIEHALSKQMQSDSRIATERLKQMFETQNA